MPRPKNPPDPYLLGKVCALYYLRDQTQQEIAEHLHLSRPTVSRLLREAREMGFVQITIASPRGLYLDLEMRLEDQFRLETVNVVDSEPGSSDELVRHRIGAAAANYLARTLRPGATIGMAWGTTLSAMVNATAPMSTSDVRVVQILGGLGAPDAADNAAELVRKLAQLLEARAVLLGVPGVLATQAVRDVLREDRHVRAALNQLDTLDTVFVGLGSLSSNAVLQDPHSPWSEAREELRSRGAVGDIALRFFDAHGSPVHTSLDDRILGITTHQLRRAGRVVAVAGGEDKIDAIAAALEAGIIKVLITDRMTGDALVARSATSRSSGNGVA
jgi:DNA-binding transcriptional regulator LsrR (DeoR family)